MRSSIGLRFNMKNFRSGENMHITFLIGLNKRFTYGLYGFDNLFNRENSLVIQFQFNHIHTNVNKNFQFGF
jgi:hypothetical protein